MLFEPDKEKSRPAQDENGLSTLQKARIGTPADRCSLELNCWLLSFI